MKIQLFSDLHNEKFNVYTHHYSKVQVHPDADVVALTGDVGSGIHSLNFASSLYQEFGKPVIWLPGNHEFYGGDIYALLKKYKAAHREGVYKLLGAPVDTVEDNSFTIGNVRFCGGTLWTDFNLYKGSVRIPTQREAIKIGDEGLNDFYQIRNNGILYTATESLKIHTNTYKILKEILETPFTGKTVVLSHHAPHKNSIHPRFSPSLYSLESKKELPGENKYFKTNPCFASHLPELVELADLWLHGHVHDSMDYIVGKCRVVANPRGYFYIDYNNKINWENPAYDALKLIEI